VDAFYLIGYLYHILGVMAFALVLRKRLLPKQCTSGRVDLYSQLFRESVCLCVYHQLVVLQIRAQRVGSHIIPFGSQCFQRNLRHPPRQQGDTEWAVCNTNGVYIGERKTIVFY
jgi:hypothetical protein